MRQYIHDFSNTTLIIEPKNGTRSARAFGLSIIASTLRRSLL
jgi:hypothetical protein